MTDTRSQLLEAATRLFLGQGFAKTTIQQLASEVGISKGAVYLHFRSKSQLLLAILLRLGETTLAEVRAIRQRDDLSPREKLRVQLRHQFDDVLEHRRLMEIYLKEAGIAIDEELLLIAQQMRVDWQQTQEEFLRLAFPEHDGQYTADLTVIVGGALNEYYTYLLLENLQIDADQVADMLVALSEAMVERLAVGDVPVVIGPNVLPQRDELQAQLAEASEQRVERILGEVLEHAATVDEDDAANIRQTVDALRTALADDTPNRIVLQGLIANLRDHKDLQPQRRELAVELDVRLI